MSTILKRVNALVFSILICYPLIVCAQEEVNNAFQHLYNVMDKYHLSFDVYTNQDAGGNNFHPTLFGDYNRIKMTSGWTENIKSGYSCYKIIYSPTQHDINQWAGIYWLYPDTNWGYFKGHEIIGAAQLNFWARGERGGEFVEFKIGGVNHFPHHDPKKYSDSCDLLSTGIVALDKEWSQYSIDLLQPDSFAIYTNSNSGSNNHYVPASWFNGSSNMQFNDDWRQNVHSPESCIRVRWNGLPGADGYYWNGIMWQAIEGDINNGYDLTGARQLKFRARTDESGGCLVKFFVGYPHDSCGEVLYGLDGWAPLENSWNEYIIKLDGKDLSNVAGGFGFAFDDVHNPFKSSLTFYLDDIKFDKPVKKDLSNIMGGFCVAVERSKNPNGCSFYLDDITYQLTTEGVEERKKQPHLLVSYEATASPIDSFIRNPCYIYDNALAMISFIRRGIAGREEDWQRAEFLGKTLKACSFLDSDTTCFLKNGYRAGDVLDASTGRPLFPGIWREDKGKQILDEFSANIHTGNIAWVITALMDYYRNRQNEEFLNFALGLARWIVVNTFDDRGAGGYMGGYEESGQSKVLWKSVEHNLDVYDAFTRISQSMSHSINDSIMWHNRAMHARHFVEAMWNPRDQFFWTGTDIDGCTINTSNLVMDIQAWAVMDFYNDATYHCALSWAKKNCYTESHGFKGFDFNNDRDGIWFEGTAHMALASILISDSATADTCLAHLRKAQKEANNSNTLGIVAASHDGVSTGFEWLYHNRLHVGATAWYLLAENRWNPYCLVEKSDDNTKIVDKFRLHQNYPNPFNSSTKIEYQLMIPSKTRVQIYNIAGKLIRTLVDDRQPAGHFVISWDGRDDMDRNVATGVYFCQIRAHDFNKTMKLLLVR